MKKKIQHFSRAKTAVSQPQPPLPTSTSYTPLLPGERLRILFVFQFSGTWQNWESLYQSCMDDPAIDAQVVLVERVIPNTRLNLLNSARHFLIENDIGFTTDQAFSMASFRPHIVFIPTPYVGTFPEQYHPHRLQALGARLAYIPYGIDMGGGSMNLRYQFNLPVQQNAWKIFARSLRHKRMYAKYCDAGSGHVEVLGHPRMDSYRAEFLHPLAATLSAKINGRRVFLWNPHFSVQKGRWSTFLDYGDTILAFFARHQDVFLIVRPHPFLFAALRDDAGWSTAQIDAFRQRVDSMPNAALDLEPNYMASMKATDVIITDAGSFLLEFFASGKPSVFLHSNQGPGLNDDGDVSDYMYNVRNHDDLERYLQLMHAGQDPELERRLRAIPEYFVMPAERSIGSAIKDHMLAAVRGHDMPLKNGFTPHLPTLASTTCNAPVSYPEHKAAALESLLSRIGRVPSAIDIGCGDGRYTRQICAHADFTKVIDADAEKVAQAKILLAGCNIEINRESITHAGTCQTYDLISCLGVTSGMTEHSLFLKALDLLVASCREDGYLLLEDTLSTGVERLQQIDEQQSLLYRNLLDYKECLLSRGCTLEAEVDLFALPDETLVNKLFLFKGKRRSNT